MIRFGPRFAWFPDGKWVVTDGLGPVIDRER